MNLETGRLILKNPEKKDLDEFYEYMNDFSMAEMHIDTFWPISKERLVVKLKHLINEHKKEDPKIYFFFIKLKSKNKIIGDVLLHSINNISKEAIIAFDCHKKYRNNNYVTEAVEVLINFALKDLGMKKIIGDPFVDNLVSNKVFRKLRFEFIEKKIKWATSIATNKKHDVNFYELIKDKSN